MVADGGAEDLDDAIAAARRAFDEHGLVDRRRAPGGRPAAAAGGLRRPRRRHPGHDRGRDGLAGLAHLLGPARRRRSTSLGWVADLAEGYEWETDLGDASPLGIPSHRWVRREATGVVGAITPWNVPHQINLAKLGPALAAGNTVVLKPAPDTPWCATVLGRLIAEETDIPAGVVNIVPSSDHRIGAVLSADPRVDQVSFTGSTATGRQVMASAADSLKKVFLELGGKSAFVILDDADLRGACAVAAFTVCTHAGQGCAITTRLLVPRRQFDEAVESTAKVLGKLPAGDPTDPGTDLRAPDQRPPARPGRGLPPPGRRGGRVVRHRRRPPRGPRPRLLRRADADRGAGQRLPGGPGGDLRPGAGGDPPRRRRPRRGPGQRLRLRAVGLGVVGRPRAGRRRGPSDPHRHGRRQRWALVSAPTCPSAATSSRASDASRASAGFEEYLETKSIAEPA